MSWKWINIVLLRERREKSSWMASSSMWGGQVPPVAPLCVVGQPRMFCFLKGVSAPLPRQQSEVRGVSAGGNQQPGWTNGPWQGGKRLRGVERGWKRFWGVGWWEMLVVARLVRMDGLIKRLWKWFSGANRKEGKDGWQETNILQKKRVAVRGFLCERGRSG